MPIEIHEVIKLIIGIFIITLPGYFLSYLLKEKLIQLERFIFGFIVGIGTLTSLLFILNILFNIKITQNITILIFTIYTIIIIIFYLIRIYKYGLPTINLSFIKNRKIILLALILVFSAIISFLPHLSNNHYLPFHVDEWIHWSYTKGVIESGSTTIINPFTGTGNIASPEIGFYLSTLSIKWLSGTNLLTIFLFMPTIIGIFLSITAYNIGERSKRKFGLESAFLIGFIPTTIRFLGPSFYVAITFALILLIFLIWAGQLRKIQSAILMAFCAWLMFIIHPPTALAGIIIMLILSIFLTIEKEYKKAIIVGIFSGLSIIAIIALYFITEIWDYSIEKFLQATSGREYPLGLPEIWINFQYLGILTWILFIIGVYYSITVGKTLKRTLCLSSVAFITIIGLYTKFGYGVSIIYERTFLYLFLVITLVAGVGLSEIRKFVQNLSKKFILKKLNIVSKNMGYIFVIIVSIFLITTNVPIHLKIHYYKLINEDDYEVFDWIASNINAYRDENNSYDKAAVDPFKASPFSTITGIYTLSSSMHPTYGYNLHNDMEQFLYQNCTNISFLEKHQLSVIYGQCDNDYLNIIYKNVYLYPGYPPIANFTYYPYNPDINDSILFTSNLTMPYGRIIKCIWDFGDGNKSIGETNGLEFDGFDDYVEIKDNPSLDIIGSVTIEMWIKPKIESKTFGLIGKPYSYQIWCSNNRFFFGVFNGSSYYGSGYSKTKATNENWTHVVGIFDSDLQYDQVQIWINGIKENSRDYNGSININNKPFRIGGALYEWKDVYFNGKISDVRIYNRALTSDEVIQNYNSSQDEDIVTQGLVCWLKMNEMDKKTTDFVGVNHGDIFGAKWINSANHKYNKSGKYQVNLTVFNERGLKYSIIKSIKIS